MLISTSRNPSQKTRIFCKNFAHATGSKYVNRGKMSIRDIFLKSIELNEINVAIVNEIKGNPSKITFYSNNNEEILCILINVTLTNERLNIIPKDLTIVSKVKKLNILSDILKCSLVDNDNSNYILIDSDDDLLAIIRFINKFGDKSEFKINVRKILE